MATAVIRGVVVAASTTRTPYSGPGSGSGSGSGSSSSGRTTKVLCACLCDSPTAAGDQRSSPYRRAPNKASPDQDESSAFRCSFTTASQCACVDCVRCTYDFARTDSFAIANISSSTAYEGGDEEDIDALRSPVEHTPSVASLGILRQKRSPLFGPESFSLRSQQPSYTPLGRSSAQFEEELSSGADNTAVEALSMNGRKMAAPNGPSNGPSRAVKRRGRSPSGGGTDINRNNGYSRNGTIVTATNMEKREHLYKILVIGELGTGKTSFIKRYVHQFFSQNYRATIGVDFALKVLHWDPNTIVRLQLWDIAGQERFGNMTRVYYKEAVGAFIVFDVTRSATFDCVSKWKEDLDSKVQLPDGSPIPCMLLANKCDQEKQGVVTSPERMDEYVKENGFAGWFETSAKENINIDEAARALVNKILLNDKLISTSDLSDSDKFNLNNSVDPSAAEAKSKCSC